MIKSTDDDRKRRNKELIERMRQGDPLNHIDVMESWYPIRGKIPKNLKALNKLYGPAEQVTHQHNANKLGDNILKKKKKN